MKTTCLSPQFAGLKALWPFKRKGEASSPEATAMEQKLTQAALENLQTDQAAQQALSKTVQLSETQSISGKEVLTLINEAISKQTMANVYRDFARGCKTPHSSRFVHGVLVPQLMPNEFNSFPSKVWEIAALIETLRSADLLKLFSKYYPEIKGTSVGLQNEERAYWYQLTDKGALALQTVAIA